MNHGVVDILDRRRAEPLQDHGTIINVVSWILMAVSMCALMARFVMKLSIKEKGKRYGLHDVLIVFAALFSIGQTVAVSVQAIQALGQHLINLEPHQVRVFQKAEYVSSMMYILNLGCARVSLCLVIRKVLPDYTSKTTTSVFIVFAGLWTLSALLVSAFPCSLPNPWQFDEGKKCIDLVKWVNYIGITNIVIEVLLVSIPLIFWNLRTSAGQRITASLLFLARLSIVVAVSAQLSFFNRYVSASDYTYTYWRTVLCVQIAQNLSIITACLPCLHPFIVKIIAGTISATSIQYDCPATDKVLKLFTTKPRNRSFDAASSESSSQPIQEKQDVTTEFCAPLATYGYLDRGSSANLNPGHCRFPSNVAQPLSTPNPPENLFMAPVNIPPSRPMTTYSSAASVGRKPSSPPPVPSNLNEVGFLPAIDWDSDSSDRDSRRNSLDGEPEPTNAAVGCGRSSAGSRRPPSEYVFHRSKVISVPEESHLTEDGGPYWKKYYPPLPSPKIPRKLSRSRK